MVRGALLGSHQSRVPTQLAQPDARHQPPYQFLVDLLSSADASSRREAVQALAQYALEVKDAAQAIAAAGGIQPLTLLLAATEPSRTRDAAICVLSCIAYDSSWQEAFVQAGIFKQALGIFTSSLDSDARGITAGMLGNICLRNRKNAEQLVADGAVPYLVSLLGEDPGCQQLAVYGLRLVAQEADLWAVSDFQSSGILDTCLGLMRSAGSEVKVEVAWLLYALLPSSRRQPSGSADSVRSTLVSGGVVQPLVHMAASSSSVQKEAAFLLLSRLMRSEHGRHAALSAGIAELLLDTLIHSKDLTSQTAACMCLTSLSDTTVEPQLRVEVANAGAAEVLVCLLSDQFSVWQALKAPAAKTFGGLSAIPPNRRILIQAGAVPVLLRLTECDCQCARENAIFALTQIVQTEDGPEALVQAGAVSVLQRVVFSRHAGWDYVFPNAMRLLQVLGAPHVDPRKADSVIMLTGRVRASAG